MLFVPITGVSRRSSEYLQLMKILKIELEINSEKFNIIFDFDRKSNNHIKGIYFKDKDDAITFKLRYDSNEFRKN